MSIIYVIINVINLLIWVIFVEFFGIKLKKIKNLIRGQLIPFKKANHKVFVESLCEFVNARWIELGGNNTIQRGTVIIADSPGSIKIGHDTTVSRYSIIQSVGGYIDIANNSQIGDYCNLYGQGGLKIGNNVMLASGIQIIPNQHGYNNLSIPIKDNPEFSEGITIEDDVWIGAGVLILDGVTVKKGSVIGAGAVVTKNIEPYSIVVGVPARKIKDRRS